MQNPILHSLSGQPLSVAKDLPTDLTGAQGYPGYPHGEGYFMGRFCLDRHKMAINLGFADSHVGRVPLCELWVQKWHRSVLPNPDVSLP